jgi:hypothetical protein
VSDTDLSESALAAVLWSSSVENFSEGRFKNFKNLPKISIGMFDTFLLLPRFRVD